MTEKWKLREKGGVLSQRRYFYIWFLLLLFFLTSSEQDVASSRKLVIPMELQMGYTALQFVITNSVVLTSYMNPFEVCTQFLFGINPVCIHFSFSQLSFLVTMLQGHSFPPKWRVASCAHEVRVSFGWTMSIISIYVMFSWFFFKSEKKETNKVQQKCKKIWYYFLFLFVTVVM